MDRPVQFLSYVYPDTIQVLVKGKPYTYRTSEPFARKAIVMMRFGDGWRGLNTLKKNGKEVEASRREKNETLVSG